MEDLLGKPRSKWDDNTKTDLKERGQKSADCRRLDHDRDKWRDVVNTVMNFPVP
jgi:hypothetical protein